MDLELFPKTFGFYSYGNLEKNTSNFDTFDPELHVLFRLHGDENSFAIVCFNHIPHLEGITEDENKSLAVELSNTLVSKFVNQVAEISDETIYISAPEVLDEDPIRNKNLLLLIHNELSGEYVRNKNARVIKQNYTFQDNSENAYVQITLLLLKSNEGHG